MPRTTLFGKYIIEAAESVLQVEYRAGNRNQFGEKLEEIVKEFDINSSKKYFTGKGKKQPDYCGITVSVILDRAFKNFDGSINTFRSASAKAFLDLAKKLNLRVDNKPQAGCLFLTKRNGGSGYHVGLVWDVEGSGIKTIEGNTYSSSSFIVRKDGCKIKLNPNEYGILSRMRPISKVEHFVHIEEIFGNETSNYQSSQAMLADHQNYLRNLSDNIPENACSAEDYDMYADGGEPNEPLTSRIPKEYFYIGGGVLALATIGIIYKVKQNS